jgi:hypothetical protein
MRRWVVAALATVLVGGIPLVVLADSGKGESDLERQTFAFRDGPVSRSSTSFRTLPPFEIVICARHVVTAALSAEVSGAPAQFRIVVGARTDGFLPRMEPGGVIFDPQGGRSSFSFTFGRRVLPFEGDDRHGFRVQWRSTTGDRSTVHGATVTLQYDLVEPGPGGFC